MKSIVLSVTFILLNWTDSLTAQEKSISDFSSAFWTITSGAVVDFDGRKCLKGSAVLKDIIFENGTIEVDVYTAPNQRAYPGVVFRMTDQQNYERVYIRPHRSGLYGDALQYVGTFNGLDSWQLFSGEGKSSRLDIPANQWNKIKIEVGGSQARLYWNNTGNPVMEITDLVHGISKGSLALFGDNTSYFSNFKYTTSSGSDLKMYYEKEKVVGIISDWEISQVFSLADVSFEEFPDNDLMKKVTWQKATADHTGMVDISRYHARKNQLGDCIFAKTMIKSDADKTVRLGFGYSDYITVFLNKKPVFFGNSAYRSRDDSFLGVVGYNDVVFLPLKKGDNELLIMVGESMGGWGFMFRDEDAIFKDERLIEQWQIRNTIPVPESVVYDAKRDICYVSSFMDEKNGSINIIKTNGDIVKLKWITDVMRPTGLAVHKDKLYCVERNRVSVIDPDSGKVMRRYPILNPGFPNDIAITKEGMIFVSDSRSGVIYNFEEDTFRIWHQSQDIAGANVLFAEEETLWIGASGSGTMKSINIKTNEWGTSLFIGKGAVLDGFAVIGDNQYLAGDNNGLLYMVYGSEVKKIILNTKTPQRNIADFVYIPEKELLIIPTFTDNKIVGYKINLK